MLASSPRRRLGKRSNEPQREPAKDNHSWRQFVGSYLIGRTLWGGDESMDHFIEACERMVADVESPWCAVSWPQ